MWRSGCPLIHGAPAGRVEAGRAACVFDGPINGACFRAYVEQLLVPILKPGDIVISGHKAKLGQFGTK